MAVGRLLLLWLALLALVGLATAAALLPGPAAARHAASLALVVLAAGLNVWFLMDLRRASPLARLFAGAALCFLAILVVLLVGDYATRGWLGG